MSLSHKLALVAVTLYGWAVPLYELRRIQAQEAVNKAKNPKSSETPKGKFSHKEKTESCSVSKAVEKRCDARVTTDD
jgi:hypothetical protein